MNVAIESIPVAKTIPVVAKAVETPTVTPVIADVQAVTQTSTALEIVALNKVAEYVDLQNVSDAAVNLRGWVVRSELGSQDCALAGMIAPGQVLRVWAQVGEGFSCEFKTTIWNNRSRDPAVLLAPGGSEVSRLE